MKVILFLLISVCFNFSLMAQHRFQIQESGIDSIMKAHLIHTGKRPVHSFLLYASNEKTGFEILRGFGVIGRNQNVIDAKYQYNCASITKTFVATIILQLEEEGKLAITDKAYKYLQPTDYAGADRIHILNDTNYSAQITIEQLLNHTSGIADIFSDARTRFNISVLLHKRRQFNTERIMKRYYRYHLNKKPFNKPGEGYHYSDMNYVFLGFIIENITGKTLPEAIRERILKKTGMNRTYFEYYEPVISEGKRIDAYLGKINMTRRINTSYEWGGGGLVTTTEDLALFIQALFNNRLYRQPSTLSKMIDMSKVEKFGSSYGYGLFAFTTNGKVYYGHGGFYGSLLLYEPVDRITFSANISQATPPYNTERLVIDLLTIINEH